VATNRDDDAFYGGCVLVLAVWVLAVYRVNWVGIAVLTPLLLLCIALVIDKIEREGT
jgi:hypothetical protein